MDIDSRISSLVTIWKYILRLPNKEILANLAKEGVSISERTLERYVLDWGCSDEIEQSYKSLHEADFRKEIYTRLDRYLNLKEPAIKTPKISKNPELTLVTSDYHCPFHREDMVFEIIKRYGDRGIPMVINGDLFDMYSMSRFLSYNKITAEEEFIKCYRLLELMASHFPEITIVTGNHDQRVFKYFCAKVGIDKMFLVNYDWGSYFAAKIPNVKIASNIIGDSKNGTHDLTHYHIIGKDCAVGHFEVSGGGKTIGKAVMRVEEWAHGWRLHTGLLPTCKLFLQGHSHSLFKGALFGGATTVGETGCMCKIQEYAVRPDARYNPSVNGWWEVYSENGYVDTNRSNYILWS